MAGECPVCGSPMEDGVCPRCGFERPVGVFGDGRDREAGGFKVPSSAEERNARLRVVIHNLETHIASPVVSREDASAAVSSGLLLLRLPLDIDERHSLSLSDLEVRLVERAASLVDRMDGESGVPCLPAEAYIRLGNAFVSMGREKRALEYYERALLSHPLHPVAMYSKASALFSLGEHEKARRVLEKALRKDPDNVQARRLMDLVVQML
ncbi:MAG: tetratricopeptide repeat protein [Thermoplasmata archaeon]|nr:tetratricopeptide repeat protein [Thermoplasmata archaeon]